MHVIFRFKEKGCVGYCSEALYFKLVLNKGGKSNLNILPKISLILRYFNFLQMKEKYLADHR